MTKISSNAVMKWSTRAKCTLRLQLTWELQKLSIKSWKRGWWKTTPWTTEGKVIFHNLQSVCHPCSIQVATTWVSLYILRTLCSTKCQIWKKYQWKKSQIILRKVNLSYIQRNQSEELLIICLLHLLEWATIHTMRLRCTPSTNLISPAPLIIRAPSRN